MRNVFAALVLSLAVSTQAAPPSLAYFGNLKGEINLPPLPPAAWTLEVSPPEDGGYSAVFALSAEGLALKARVQSQDSTDAFRWKIDEGRLDLHRWLPGLIQRYTPALTGTQASGEWIISGEGHLEGFHPVGHLSLRCENATVRNETDGWTLEGVRFEGVFSLDKDFSLKSASPFVFGIQTITTSRLGARAFSLTGRLENVASLSVDSARLEIAGGEVESGAFTAPLSPLSIDTRVRMRRIGLQDFVQLFPTGLADARGRLDGELSLGWSPAEGFRLGIGKLALDEFEPTVIRLSPSPGLLTSRIPARFEFLPGALGRWLAIRNRAYEDLQDIELGESDLRVNSLRVLLTPEGDAEGRSARVFLDAGPVQANEAVKQIVFTINVSGPLSRLLNLGMTDNLSFETP